MSTETIRWLMADSVKPDDAESVLIALSEPDGDPTWVGWYDSAEDGWRCASSGVLLRTAVSYWAPMPRGPV
jgi:hypothetical protein